MLHRSDTEGLIVITQPAHAWVSGQLARNWGTDIFTVPMEEVCLAAEQHDIGFLAWEQSPTLNLATGLPHTFMEMPAADHLDVWRTGIRQMTEFHRYAALLVSLHFTVLAQRHQTKRPPDEKRLVDDFLAEQGKLQMALLTSLRNDRYYAPFSTDELTRRDQQLVSVWDWLSLLICQGMKEPTIVHEVPARGGFATITLTQSLDLPYSIAVHPWPFCTDSLKLVCEGRRLLQTFSDQDEMMAALQTAAPVRLAFELVQA